MDQSTQAAEVTPVTSTAPTAPVPNKNTTADIIEMCRQQLDGASPLKGEQRLQLNRVIDMYDSAVEINTTEVKKLISGILNGSYGYNDKNFAEAFKALEETCITQKELELELEGGLSRLKISEPEKQAIALTRISIHRWMLNIINSRVLPLLYRKQMKEALDAFKGSFWSERGDYENVEVLCRNILQGTYAHIELQTWKDEVRQLMPKAPYRVTDCRAFL